MATLDGSARPVQVAPGYWIAAQGLRGRAEAHAGRAPGTRDGGMAGGGAAGEGRGRGIERATAALDEALAAAGMAEVQVIELEVSAVPPAPAESPVRTSGGQDGMVLDVPDLGPDAGQVVLAIDEEGVCTWNYPLDQPAVAGVPSRGNGATKRFVIRRHVPTPPDPSEGANRGLVGLLGRKLLKVLVYPVTDAVLGPIGEHFAASWEQRKRPYGLRAFGPEDRASARAPSLSADRLRDMAGGPALLFVHGTFATAGAAFVGLPKDTLAALHRAYEGRVFAFNHFTLSDDPEGNVAWLRDQLPSDVDLRLDIVSHSRGGLVARTIAGELPGTRLERVRVGRVVFVGTPNHGTALADPDHMVGMLDRFTSVLNLAPPGPLSVVADTLEAILTVVKVIGHAGLSGLTGLASMTPGGEFLRRLNVGEKPEAVYHAIAADFSPLGSLRELVTETVADRVMDRVFGTAANDLVVPTLGVSEGGNDPAFPIPAERLLSFNASEGIGHSHFFSHPKTSRKLLEWLRP